ncbi:MAG TPA: HAMP domain-containing protein, partial [Ruminiclostridium sp.]|nr:HAMP domain-containing protein [Ruminiclostridium sp.]
MKEKGQKYSSLRKKIFLASFIPALIVCILAAVIQASHLSSGITYIGLAVILAIVLVISVTFSQNAAKPVNAIAYAVRELKKGHIHARCSIKTNDDIGQIAQDIDSFADNYEKNIIGTLQNIADGKFSDQIQTVDKDDIASLSAKNAVLTINSIVSEVKTVVNAAADGDFSVRCNQDKFKGAWKTLACDTNEFCESSSSTLNEISTIINKYSVNDFDLRMKNEYKGIFQAVANDLNVHGDLINRFEKLIIQISDGDLSQMDYIEKIGRLSESDKFLPAICKMMRAVYELTNEVNYLSDEAVNGNILNIRGDTDKFSGCYKNIVSGFNATLDAISAPLLEAFKVLTKTAVGDFTEEFEGDYKGEFDNLAKAVKGIQSNFKIIYKAVSMISKGDLSMLEKLKTAGKMSENDVMVPAFITLMESITLLTNESTRIADAAAGGNLNLRCDTSKAGGVFENILESINSLLDKVEKPAVEITHKM